MLRSLFRLAGCSCVYACWLVSLAFRVAFHLSPVWIDGLLAFFPVAGKRPEFATHWS